MGHKKNFGYVSAAVVTFSFLGGVWSLASSKSPGVRQNAQLSDTEHQCADYDTRYDGGSWDGHKKAKPTPFNEDQFSREGLWSYPGVRERSETLEDICAEKVVASIYSAVGVPVLIQRTAAIQSVRQSAFIDPRELSFEATLESEQPHAADREKKISRDYHENIQSEPETRNREHSDEEPDPHDYSDDWNDLSDNREPDFEVDPHDYDNDWDYSSHSGVS